jgi:hypothetical protein
VAYGPQVIGVKIIMKEHVVCRKGNKIFVFMWHDKLSALSISQQERHMGLKEGRMWNAKSNVISDYSETMCSYLHVMELVVCTGNN